MLTFHVLQLKDLMFDMLDSFERTQRTTRVFVKQDGKFIEKADSFEDDWNMDKKRDIVRHFEHVIQNGGGVVVARQGDELIGFSVIESESFGVESIYKELSYLHVTLSARGMKVGERLFNKTKEVAKALGADKLYIGSHPTIETQYFYREMGCVPATEINERIYEREIRDIQLEVKL